MNKQEFDKQSFVERLRARIEKAGGQTQIAKKLGLKQSARAAALVHVSGLAADERFVRLNLSAQFTKLAGAHRLADSVEHEPCGFLRDAERAAERAAGFLRLAGAGACR